MAIAICFLPLALFAKDKPLQLGVWVDNLSGENISYNVIQQAPRYTKIFDNLVGSMRHGKTLEMRYQLNDPQGDDGHTKIFIQFFDQNDLTFLVPFSHDQASGDCHVKLPEGVPYVAHCHVEFNAKHNRNDMLIAFERKS